MLNVDGFGRRANLYLGKPKTASPMSRPRATPNKGERRAVRIGQAAQRLRQYAGGRLGGVVHGVQPQVAQFGDELGQRDRGPSGRGRP
jgi:hypothetical protein